MHLIYWLIHGLFTLAGWTLGAVIGFQAGEALYKQQKAKDSALVGVVLWTLCILGGILIGGLLGRFAYRVISWFIRALIGLIIIGLIAYWVLTRMRKRSRAHT